MEKQRHFYDALRHRAEVVKKENLLYKDVIKLSDIDGVINATKDLMFHEESVTAAIVASALADHDWWLTGRYLDLMAHDGLPVFEKLGWEPTNFALFGEMGGVKFFPATDDTSDTEKLLACELTGGKVTYGATLLAPEVTPELRQTVWSAYIHTLRDFIKSGKLIEAGINTDAVVTDNLALHFYDPERANRTKATLTTSIVPAAYKDQALMVHRIIGEQLAQNINDALRDYNEVAERKICAVSHLDCVEVLFSGINKYQTTRRMLEASSCRTVITVGDSYKDTDMSAAARDAGKETIHFHVGNADIYERSLSKESRSVPHYSVVYPEFDPMYEAMPNMQSVSTHAVAMFDFVKTAVENPNTTSWEELLSKLKFGKLIIS